MAEESFEERARKRFGLSSIGPKENPEAAGGSFEEKARKRFGIEEGPSAPVEEGAGPPPGYTRLLPPENVPPEPPEFTLHKQELEEPQRRYEYVKNRLGPLDAMIYRGARTYGGLPSREGEGLQIPERVGRLIGGAQDLFAGAAAAPAGALAGPAAPVAVPAAFGAGSAASQYAREKGVGELLGEDSGDAAMRAVKSGAINALTAGLAPKVAPFLGKALPDQVTRTIEEGLKTTRGRALLGTGLGAGQEALRGGDIADILEGAAGGSLAMAGPGAVGRAAGGAAKTVGRAALRPEVVGTAGGFALGGVPGAAIGFGVGSGALEKIPMFSRIGSLTKGYKRLYDRAFPAESQPRTTSVKPGEFGGTPEPAPMGPQRGLPEPSQAEIQGILARVAGRSTNPEAAFQAPREGAFTGRAGFIGENPMVGEATPPTPEEAVAALRARLARRKGPNPEAGFQPQPEPGPPPAGMVRDVGERVAREPIRVRGETMAPDAGPRVPPASFEIDGPMIEPSPRGGPPPSMQRYGPALEGGPVGKAGEMRKLIEKLVEPPKPPKALSAEAEMKARMAAEPDFEKKADIAAEWEAMRKKTGLGTAGGQVSAGGALKGAGEVLDRLQAENPEQHFEVKIKKADGDVRTVTGSFRPRGLKNRMELLKENPAMASEDLEKLYRSQAGAPKREGVGPAVEEGRKFWDAENQKWITLKHENVLEIRSQELPDRASKTLWKKD